MSTIGPGKWPYPDGTAVPFPPDDIQKLALRVSMLSGAGIGYCALLTDRTALVTNGDAFTGLRVYVAETDSIDTYLGGGSWATRREADAAGTITAGVAVNAATTQAVTFPAGKFTAVPRIFVSCESGRLNLAVTARSTSGFTMTVNNWSNADAAAGTLFWWYAIQTA